MNWSSNSVWTAAGGTSTANYAEDLNETSLRNKLRDFSTSLTSYIQSNTPNASVEQILGGQSIDSSVAQPLSEGLAFTVLSGYSSDWDYIPTNMMSSLKVTVDLTTNRFLWMPQLQGQRLSLTFSNSGMAQLWLEDDLLLQKQTSGGSSVNVALSVNHPHGYWDWTNNKLINTNWNDQATTNSYQRTNASYAIAYAFEPHRDWLRQRQEKLDYYKQQGLADTSREITTETLNIMGLNWMLQTARIPQVLASQHEMLLQYHHRFGRMAQEYGKGYYIDVYQQLSGIYPASGNGTNDVSRMERVFDVESYFASAAEHGLIEQLQSSDLVAASTVKMVKIANGKGQKIYLANSSNWSSIQSGLNNYNNNNWLRTNFIEQGYSLLLPANAENQVAGAGTWKGYGIVARRAVGGSRIMQMLIGGDYNGGYVSNPYSYVDTPYVYQSSYVQPVYFNPVPPLVGSPFGADPVSMADGTFQITATDLSIGQAEPRGITLARHYSSSRRRHNLAGLANGWVHNYYAKATEVSAPLAVLGDTTPAQMAAMVVATRSAVDFYDAGGTPKNWAITALIAKWGVDQTVNNAVSVTLGKDTLQFVEQPDGSYTPPAGSTMTLLKTNGVYRLKERHGSTYRFGSKGFLTNIVDQFSQGLSITYNSSNWVQTIKDWKDRQFTFHYTGTPLRLTSVTDNTAPSRTVGYGYTGDDLTSATDPENKRSGFIYDSGHQIIATKDALNRAVVSNAYDNFGRVVEQYSHGDTNKTWQLFWSGFLNTEKDPAGGRKQFNYDEKHRLVRTTDAMGHSSDRLYDGQDHVIETVSHLNARTLFQYDGRHNLVMTVDPLGATNEFFYDAQDNLVRASDARKHVSTFGYNSKFQMTGSTNGAGDWLVFKYSGVAGSLTNRADAGGQIAYGYDVNAHLNKITYVGGLGSEGFLNSEKGDVLSHTNARGFVTSYQYNARRELTNTIAPTNLMTRVVFDAVGNVLGTADARGFTTSNAWSATRKLLATTLPATAQGVPVTTNSYDSRDWLSRSVGPLQQLTLYTNDAAQRLVSVTDPVSRTTRFVYDADNRRTFATNAAQEITRQEWSARGDLIQVSDHANRSVKRAYDEAGNQVLLTNRNGKVWQFQFDGANRLTNTISPLGRQTKQLYNNRGLLQTVIEPSNDAANLYYDSRGRLTNRTDSVGSIFYRYDANNNRTNVVEGGKTNTWTFDAYDRVSSYRDSEGNLIQYRMDANGNVTNLIYPGGKTVKYFFDSLNRLTNVTDWADRKTSIEYDLASQVRRITRPNGTTREMNYDSAGQLTNIVEKTLAGNVINLFKLNWNAAARVEWEFAAPLPHAFTPPSRTMTFDDDNRILTFNGQAVGHDLDGNMTTGPLTNNTLVSYTFDARNRLRSAGGLNYTYDPSADRIAITNGANVTRFVVNPNAALSQVLLRVKNGVTNYYVYGVGLLYEADDAGNTKTYHFDFQGSTVALADGAGNVTDRIEYSAYGSITYRAGNTDTPFLFNGRYGVQSDANGLLYMRARYYNPYICRFVNPDPAGFSGGLNFYAYADGNPISRIDPFGLYGNPVSGADGPVGPSSLYAPGGAGYVPSHLPPPGPMTYLVGGVVVGVAGAAVVTFAAPVAVSGLVAVGVPAATATATVTTTLGVAGAVGAGVTIGDAVYNGANGNWNNVAFDPSSTV